MNGWEGRKEATEAKRQRQMEREDQKEINGDRMMEGEDDDEEV